MGVNFGRIVLTMYIFSICGETMGQHGAISGRVIQQRGNLPLMGVTIQVLTSQEAVGAVSGKDGRFSISGVPYGNHTIELSFVGFERRTLFDIAVYDRKGPFFDIVMQEDEVILGEVTVRAHDDPVATGDPSAWVSARGISMEETKRFAGGLGDPSRLALSYAGVNSGRGDDNDIIVRGNPSKYLRWQLEGLEIPNPNHFGSHGGSGGLFNILNSSTLARSDFYLGAVPAHTGNALAGVFNLSIRNGNPLRHKHSIETSLIGLSALSEGPLAQSGRASYLVNYRYSSLGLLKQLGIVFQAPEYQDLVFRVHFPVKSGAISVYGFGGLGQSLEQEFFRRIDSTRTSTGPSGAQLFGFDEIAADNLERYNLGVIGVKHELPVDSRHLLANHLTYSEVFNAPQSTGLDALNFLTFLEEEGRFRNRTLRYKPELVIAIADKNELQLGAIATFRRFSSRFVEGFPDMTTRTIADVSAVSFLGQTFLFWTSVLTSKLQISAGVHQTYFSLSDQVLVEPRGALRYRIGSSGTLSLASGLHSAAEPAETYTTLRNHQFSPRTGLSLTRSWHNVLSYKQALAGQLHFTTELYHQYLFDIPIAVDSSNFSLINEEAPFVDQELVNEGEGLNYGLELTLEKTWSKSYYFLITASIYQSEYRLFDPFFRKSSYSNGHVFNVLGGKEFELRENRFFGLNTRGTWSGGKPYIPVLLEQSIEQGMEVRDNQRAYLLRLPAYIGVDLSMYYRWMQRTVAHEVKLDIFRLFEQNYEDEVFVPEALNYDGSVSPASVTQTRYGEGQSGGTIIPVIYYKLTF